LGAQLLVAGDALASGGSPFCVCHKSAT
jgi:hypothetical protein